jgi:hypothetical protein
MARKDAHNQVTGMRKHAGHLFFYDGGLFQEGNDQGPMANKIPIPNDQPWGLVIGSLLAIGPWSLNQ